MRVTYRLKDNINEVLPDFEQKRALGYRAFSGVENQSSPFFGVIACASRDNTLDYSTSIAVAFARSPVLMATEGYSVNQFCQGRFSLGIASQIKPHVVRRFGMPWTGAPATQMREYIAALHAVWDSFETGKPLDFHGETYTHTLMTPEYVPANEFGRPRIHLGAVGPGMTRVAGELCDGIVTHSFVSEKGLREITLANVLTGLERAGKPRSSFEIVFPILIVTGTTEEEFAANREFWRNRIGFFASTPAYKHQLDFFGWGDLMEECRQMIREGRWDELGDPITDEMIDTFTVMGEPKAIAPKIAARFGDFVDTLRIEIDLADQEVQYEIVKAIEAI